MSEFYHDDAAVHLESLRLLSEVAEYLGRLPPNALTREMKVKIANFISLPSQSVRIERLENFAKDADWCARFESGNAFIGATQITPTGLPILQCLVMRGAVYMQSPMHKDAITKGDAESAERVAVMIGREVATGLSLELRTAHAVLDKGVFKLWPRVN